MQIKTKDKLSNILISVGVILILVAVGYEAANYPWRILLTDWGILQQEELPDPPPLPTRATTASGEASTADETGDIPITPTWISTRPVMNITQLGVIKIPKLGISENIVEGSKDELLYGVGHVRGTTMPGQAGNCVLGGHRNYIVMHPFRHMDKMKIGDLVYITDNENQYTYEAFKIVVIEPTDSWILKPIEEEYQVTLMTCTPVINPTHRLTVWCKLIDTKPLV